MTGGFEEVIPYATILTGPYKGKVVGITDISIYYADFNTGIFLYDPEFGIIKSL